MALYSVNLRIDIHNQYSGQFFHGAVRHTEPATAGSVYFLQSYPQT